MVPDPNDNPDVRRTPALLRSGAWATIGSAVGLIAQVLQILPYSWAPAAFAFCGWLTAYVFGPPSYTVLPKPKAADVIAYLQAQVSELQKQTGIQAKPTQSEPKP